MLAIVSGRQCGCSVGVVLGKRGAHLAVERLGSGSTDWNTYGSCIDSADGLVASGDGASALFSEILRHSTGDDP